MNRSFQAAKFSRMRTTRELVEAAAANALQAAQILRHAALESRNSSEASEFWQKASQLETVAESLTSLAKAGTKIPSQGDKKK